jgi:hypothetical protein
MTTVFFFIAKRYYCQFCNAGHHTAGFLQFETGRLDRKSRKFSEWRKNEAKRERIPKEREIILSVLKRGLSPPAVFAVRAYSETGRLDPAIAEVGRCDFTCGSVSAIGFVCMHQRNLSSGRVYFHPHFFYFNFFSSFFIHFNFNFKQKDTRQI